jgi:hypothetical protein
VAPPSTPPGEPFAFDGDAGGDRSPSGEVFAVPEEPLEEEIDPAAEARGDAEEFQERADISAPAVGTDVSPDIESSENSGDWSAVELAKSDLEVDAEAPQPDVPEPVVGPDDPDPGAEAPAADVAALEARLAKVTKSLQRRTAVLGSVILVLTIAAGVGFGYLYQRLQQDVARLENDKVGIDAMVEGLGLTTEGRTAEESLRAKLRDLATASIQSGAWQEGLKSRGTTPEEFLDHLVALSEVHDSLLKLARQETGLLRLARVVSSLVPVAEHQNLLVAMTEHAEALETLAEVQTNLVELAANRRALQSLAENEEALEVLAGHRSDLVGLASQRPQLDETVLRVATFETMSREVANVLTFMERRQRDLDRLAGRTDALLGLADSGALEDLTARQAELKRLLDRSEALGALADDVARLRALSANADELVVLARERAAKR